MVELEARLAESQAAQDDLRQQLHWERLELTNQLTSQADSIKQIKAQLVLQVHTGHRVHKAHDRQGD